MKKLFTIFLFLFNPLMIDQYFVIKEKIAHKRYQIAKNFYIKDKSKEDFNIILAKKLNRLSFYNLVPQQTDDDPYVASCGPIERVKETIIALSQDLFFDKNRKKHLCGKKVKIISDLGIFEGIVYDTMNSRYIKSADIVVDTYEKAIKLGISKNAILIVYED
ncbi:hypothetical protein YS40_089 [Thermus phage phiYS40]|uniref:hypothetical protein n=1 Tax=Thermus phage phiYS40 TaxID=407392 RepID=UPI0000E689CF|nr:hypothetical protein YS40_089 [Thermus phage phiYS40]ABJ91483.1 hypothetical protein YS40_089 [Thermus phage phiYS40]BAK53607.1 hypothetical protein YSP_089 [Thermus phage phiYS40]